MAEKENNTTWDNFFFRHTHVEDIAADRRSPRFKQALENALPSQ